MELPETSGNEHLLSDLSELGYQCLVGFESTPLTWSDIHGWSIATDTPLNPWEVVALRRMSEAFVDQSRKSGEEDSPPPWSPFIKPTRERRKKVDNFFRAFVARRRNQ